MMHSGKLYHWLVLLLAAAFFSQGTGRGEIVCPGAYGGHLQGVTVDADNAIYWSFTKDLVKTDSKGQLIKTVSVPDHHGDLTYHDKRIYIAVNFGSFNEEAGQADSWVFVYEATTLGLVSKHRIPEVVFGAGGIAHRNDHFFVVGGLPKGHTKNYVYEYDQDFTFLKKHVLESDYTLMGIQTACFSQGFWWFGCYGKTPSLLKADPSFQFIGRYHFACSLGISEFNNNTFLIGRRVGEKQHRGKLLSAKMHNNKGLLIAK